MHNFVKYIIVLAPICAAFLNGFYLPYIQDYSLLGWLEDIFRFVILPCVSLYFALFQYKWSSQSIGLSLAPITRKDAFRRNVVADIALALTICIPLYFISNFLAPAFIDMLGIESLTLRGSVILGRGWFVAIYMAATAAIVEELFYRGVLKKGDF